MIDIKSIIEMLQSSDIISEEVAFAKGRRNLPLTFKEVKQLIKIRKNGYK